MARETQYQTFPNIDLSVAGRERVTGPFGYLKIIEIVNTDGSLALDASVNARLGTFEADPFPLRHDGEANGEPGAWDQIEIAWAAQPGKVLTFLAAYDPVSLSIDAKPSSQLLLGTGDFRESFPDKQTDLVKTFMDAGTVPGAASNYGIALLRNPAGSGSVVYLTGAHIRTNNNMTMVLQLNPGWGVAAYGPNAGVNKRPNEAAGVAQTAGNRSVAFPTGEDVWRGSVLGVDSKDLILNQPLVLAPGQHCGIVATATGEAFDVSWQWYEEVL